MQGWDFLYFTSHALSLDSLSSRGCRNFMKLISFTVTASMQILNSCDSACSHAADFYAPMTSTVSALDVILDEEGPEALPYSASVAGSS